MLALEDNLALSIQSLRAHKLRAALTMLGLTMGVATLITVMTLVQGANLYVEQKIANLGTDVFQIQRLPFVPTDFDLLIKALRYKFITLEDMEAVAEKCRHCDQVGGEATTPVRTRVGDKELMDTRLIGQTASMARIDTRTIEQGRFFTDVEDRRAVPVCLIGGRLAEEFFAGLDPLGRTVRLAEHEFTIIGTFEKVGSVLGQDQDNFAVISMNSYRRIRGSRMSVTINVKAVGESAFEEAQDDARLILRARRQLTGNRDDDFFFGTKQTYISLWQQISGAFFAVFVMVSSVSAVVGGIVIMNVMLVSVTERTKEIGIRRAVGATQTDIRNQFLAESVIQCLAGGAIGILGGFVVALLLRQFTAFPAAVRTWVVILGVVLSSIIGLFFGIYPATRAARLDPVAALRSE